MSERAQDRARRYWTSLDGAGTDPAAQHPMPGQEFPEGASLAPDELSRREMLGLVGGTLALAGLSGCRRPVEKIVPFVKAPEDYIPGRPKYYATAMTLGAAGYGMLVESHEGRPTKVEGNELHPASRGSASAWMQAAILDLYDPDRSARVRRRAAPAATGGGEAFEDATWADFVTFWQGLEAAHLADGGAGLAVLGEGYASPTLARLATELAQRFPRARWVSWEPAGDGQIHEGLRRATGQALRPVYHLDRARVIVALDADLLLTEADAVAHARGWAASRRPGAEMCRFYAVESTLTLTGCAADHRVRLASREIAPLVAALARALADRGLTLPLPAGGPADQPPELAATVRAIADDLLAARGAALVAAGRGQGPAVHALVQAINVALAAPVSLHPLTDVAPGDPAGLAALADDLRQGTVSTLVILGGNPVYDAPADLAFAEAMAKAAHTVHLALRPNETTRLAEWQLPQAHFLEAWGDARAADGTASVVQPLIAPLLGGRSALEVAALVATGAEQPGYELVRATWQGSILGGLGFEERWRQALHDGVAAGATPAAVTAGLDAAGLAAAYAEAAAAPPGEGLEVTFRPSANLFDGRFANNAWLQELPDPITKITWNNVALLSPASAAAAGVGNGDVVRVEHRGRQLEAPVWVQAGQADGSLTLVLGYGHEAAGRVGSGVGYDAYRLRDSAAPWIDAGVTLTPAGRRVRLVQTQEYWQMEGRDLVREATVGELLATPHFATEPHGEGEDVALFPPFDYSQGHQWGMAIDLNSCIGCNACVVACQSENNIPVVGPEQVSRGREMHWLRVDRYYAGDPDSPEVVFQPMPCQHCENAPCEQVCPVAATVHDREGINAMVYNRCVGTRYCSNNCPYKVRRFNFFNFTKDTPEITKLAMNPDVTVRSRGVMEKCTFCIQRINAGKIDAKREGRDLKDGEILTACQQTCPTQAITFGDINDPASAVSRAKGEGRNYVLLEELANKPRASYLAKVRNPRADWEGEA